MTNQRDLIAALGKRFIQRKDVKAIQKPDGSWTPAREKIGEDEFKYYGFKMEDFTRHLAGQMTLGHYMVDQDNACKLFAFDIDLRAHDGTPEKGPISIPSLKSEDEPMAELPISVFPREVWTADADGPEKRMLTIQLRCIADGLAMRIHRTLGVSVAIANSGGKGLHVYGFTGTIPADVAREMALGVLDDFGCFEPSKGKNFYRHTADEYEALEIEVFPKQDNMDGKEFGNLMALPLGVNQKTKNEKYFITSTIGYDKLMSMDPMRALEGDLPWE